MDTPCFGVLLIDLENNFSQRVKQYPKDMTEAHNLLVKHKPSPDINNKSRRDRRRERGVRMNKKGRTYWPKTRRNSIMGPRAITAEKENTTLEIVLIPIKEKGKRTWTCN